MSPRRSRGPGRWLLVCACVVVVAAVAAAVVAIGPPSAQRAAKLDRKRVAELNRIAGAVRAYYERQDALPPDLRALADEPGRRLSIADPQTGAPYDYEVTGPSRFRLCALFATDTAQAPGAYTPALDEWHHGAGRHCFERDADDDSDAG